MSKAVANYAVFPLFQRSTLRGDCCGRADLRGGVAGGLLLLPSLLLPRQEETAPRHCPQSRPLRCVPQITWQAVLVIRKDKSSFGHRSDPRNQCCGSVSFFGGSGSADPCLWLIDPDLDYDIFYINFQREKVIKSYKTLVIKVFSFMIEGSGSWSRRPKNIRIRIRIRNTTY